MIRYKVKGELLPSGFCELLPLLAQRTFCLILDRDGTLVPLTDIPDQAVLSTSTIAVINDLAKILDVPPVVVSARGLNTLCNEFDPKSLVLAGNYGLEISYPTGQQFLHPQASHSRAQIFEVFDELKKLVLINPLLFLDNHELSLCLHFQNLPENERRALHLFAQELQLNYSLLWFRRLPTSYEILPALEWTKANALEKISSDLSLGKIDPLYITFGDSEADEPMFQWTNQRQGISFNVGSRATMHALGGIDTPEDVTEFLINLAEMVRSNVPVQLREGIER